jgi:hypothetical protein
MPQVTTCTVDGCGRRHVPGVDGGTKELCPLHYGRKRRKRPMDAPARDDVPRRPIVLQVHCETHLARWAKKWARHHKLSVSAFVERLVREHHALYSSRLKEDPTWNR